jgi:LAGLIDADG endonuclease
MMSDNPSGADNQQERPGLEEWVVGFVDGEGCFSISVVRNRVCRLGWQVQHEFSVTQAASSRSALELVGCVLGRGSMIENARHDNHREPLLRWSVKRRSDLMERVVPFFEEHPLRTAKRHDFDRFAAVLAAMQEQAHLSHEGLRWIAAQTELMNRRQRSRYLESSEAIRQPTPTDQELKIWS